MALNKTDRQVEGMWIFLLLFCLGIWAISDLPYQAMLPLSGKALIAGTVSLFVLWRLKRVDRRTLSEETK